jgi:ATP-dependent DNA helicase RecG
MSLEGQISDNKSLRKVTGKTADFPELARDCVAFANPAPVPEEGPDWVKVTIKRRIMKPEVIQLIAQADARYQLAQRERITLAALAQSEGMTARELATLLDVGNTDELASWFGRLLKVDLVQSTGRTQATRYFVDPDLLRDSGIKLPTTLKRIEPHRLQELVREDLRRYPRSKIGEISLRIGPEVHRSQLKRSLAELVKRGVVVMDGVRNGARYRLAIKE